MIIDRKTVQYIAELSKLTIPDDEIDIICADLSKMLGFMDEINSTIDTNCITQHDNAVIYNSFMREDFVSESMKREDLLSNVPVRSEETPIVPIIVR